VGPIAAKLIKAYPLPTAPGLTNNNVTNPTKTQDWNQFDARVDHEVTAADAAFAALLLGKTETVSPLTFSAVQIAGVPRAIGIGNEDTFAGTAALTAQHVVLAGSILSRRRSSPICAPASTASFWTTRRRAPRLSHSATCWVCRTRTSTRRRARSDLQPVGSRAGTAESTRLCPAR